LEIKLEPLQKELRDRAEEVNDMQNEVVLQMQKLDALNSKLEELHESMDSKEQRLNSIEETIGVCKNQLERLCKITEGLKAEKSNWVLLLKQLEEKRFCSLGDILISCAIFV